ncbi:hypothetical protein GBA65_02300 [Rubrobacter marinus]|uniref:Uncharacterized protein n=1 Tax=Rubrobacter marinus TaxID=2653852 RepID=A0A6G8PTK2_9ACTN|nr:hypothetical protein [Rubrobacter marinus]QIN77527.1 hypothetical protein GBA65_02300 [Rubrobacter marinus]
MTTLSTHAADLAALDDVVAVPEEGVSGVLAGRKTGSIERDRLKRRLGSLGSGSVLGVDARASEFMNFSFADECFRVLAQELSAGEAEDRYVVLILSSGEQEDLMEEIQVALERKKLAMLIADVPEEGPAVLDVVGELPDYLAHTLASVRPGDTNDSLAERLSLKLTTCSNRTDRLAKLRLLRKQRRQGGLGYKQFEFFPVLRTAGTGHSESE